MERVKKLGTLSQTKQGEGEPEHAMAVALVSFTDDLGLV
jgi:hypothetical protein